MQVDWNVIRQTAAQYFSFSQLVRGFAPDNVLSPISHGFLLKNLYVGPVDWAWGPDQDIKNTLVTKAAAYIDRCNQVDILVAEAAALIERALGDVLKYDELNVEADLNS